MSQQECKYTSSKSGICYNMFQEKDDIKYDTAEILRSDLIQSSITVKILPLGDINLFFQKAIQPPPPSSISHAIACLQQIKALDNDNNLTIFGHFLSRVPMDHRNATMLLYGIVFSCLHPLIVIACFDELKPFIYTNKRKAMWKRRPMSHYELYELYQQYSRKFPVSLRDSFCRKHHLSIQVMSEIDLMTVKIMKNLKDMNCVISNCVTHPMHNINSHIKTLVGALIFASHPDHLFKSENRTGAYTVQSKFNVKVDHNPQFEIGSYYVFSSGILFHGVIHTSSFSRLSPMQLIFFSDDQNEIFFDSLSKLGIASYLSELKTIRSGLHDLVTNKKENPSSIALSKSSLLVELIVRLFSKMG